MNLAVLLTSIALLRNDAFLCLLEPTASVLLHGDRSKDYVVEKVLEPLSPLNWFMHSLPLAINLIIMPTLYRRMTSPEDIDVGMTLRASSRRVAQALFAFRHLAHLQGLAALLNYCIIDVNHDVNLALRFIFSAFNSSSCVWLGLDSLAWLDCLSARFRLGGKRPAYKAAWAALVIVPTTLIMDTSTDFRHMMATAIIDGLRAVMTFSLTHRLKETKTFTN